MGKHARFHLNSLADLRAELADMGLSLPVSDSFSILGQPVELAGRVAPNRILAQPMEGFDAVRSGGPGELTFRRYKRYAAGGFGIIWIEATAVLDEGRSNPGQLYIHAGNAVEFRRLVSEMRSEARDKAGQDPLIIIQLTHSGRYSKPRGVPSPMIAHHSPVLDPRHNLPADYPLVTDEYLDMLKDQYVEAAGLAVEAGADGVDIKSCHRYLVSELLASYEREGRYGGSYENRTRLLRETVQMVRERFPEIIVTTRMSAYDAIDYPYGFGVSRESYRIPDLAEPVRLAGELAEAGVPMLNISIGNPYFNPHFGRPFDFPIKGMNVPDEHPLAGIERFINITGTIQQSVPGMAVVASGYSWLRHLMPYVAAAAIEQGRAQILGIGRGAFAYPDAPRDIVSGAGMDPARCCVACSACTQIMRDGGMTGCVVRDSDIYGPQYRAGRRFAVDRLKEEARRCRDCQTPTCEQGCPASVDVPAFIRAFLKDDIKGAYDILKRRNALPEMCAYVCPSEEQCEGCCIEKVFGNRPVAIRDIQMGVCRLARQAGLTGVNVPEEATGRKIAVVGGGPAGLGCAIKLIEAGHHVVIFEKDGVLGGTPETIIPEARLSSSKDEIAAILEPALEAGRLEVRTGVTLGRDIHIEGLAAGYDAVLVAIGLGRSLRLNEEKAEGVCDALVFLRDGKRGPGNPVKGRRVAVVGGGNTAMDCAATAVDLGARDVYLVYRRSFMEMPAWPEERNAVLAKGVHLMILTQPVGYETDAKGSVTGLRVVRTELSEADEGGRRRPVAVAGTETVLRVDVVVEAIGQEVEPEAYEESLRLKDGSGRPMVKSGEIVSAMPGVFCSGDFISGGSTAVQSIREGMDAAERIEAYLDRS